MNDITIHENMLEQRLREIIQKANGRNLMILGCRGISAIVCCGIQCLGSDVLCFLNPELGEDGLTFLGKEVLPVHRILYEDKGNNIIINTWHYRDKTDNILNLYDFIKQEDCFDLDGLLKSDACDLIDPSLGYSRKDDIRIYGRPDL